MSQETEECRNYFCKEMKDRGIIKPEECWYERTIRKEYESGHVLHDPVKIEAQITVLKARDNCQGNFGPLLRKLRARSEQEQSQR